MEDCNMLSIINETRKLIELLISKIFHPIVGETAHPLPEEQPSCTSAPDWLGQPWGHPRPDGQTEPPENQPVPNHVPGLSAFHWPCLPAIVRVLNSSMPPCLRQPETRATCVVQRPIHSWAVDRPTTCPRHNLSSWLQLLYLEEEMWETRRHHRQMIFF